jgi:acyl-CoA synthetase (AMP-forming)/AMP-acid ligase II
VAGPGVTADDVFAHCAQQLAGYKKPSEVRIVGELPHNNSGKIQKHTLRDQLLAEASPSSPE